jgi:hypothetical protein
MKKGDNSLPSHCKTTLDYPQDSFITLLWCEKSLLQNIKLEVKNGLNIFQISVAKNKILDQIS